MRKRVELRAVELHHAHLAYETKYRLAVYTQRGNAGLHCARQLTWIPRDQLTVWGRSPWSG